MKFKKGDLIIEENHEHCFSAYLRAGFEAIEEDNEEAEKQALIEKLEEAGVKIDKRWGLERLQEEVNKL